MTGRLQQVGLAQARRRDNTDKGFASPFRDRLQTRDDFPVGAGKVTPEAGAFPQRQP